MKYIKRFQEIGMQDVGLVGGKNASLGEMITGLQSVGITVPNGFAVTAQAYWHYINENQLGTLLQAALAPVMSTVDVKKVQEAGARARAIILQGKVPTDLAAEINSAYQELSALYNGHNVDVAVRSSATAEDLPTASFAGQQETFLNVTGADQLIESYKKCLASLFTDRAIVYRIEQGFDHFKVALSVGVQKMIRSDLSCSGVAFSLDTETGFKDVVMIDASWGLGESIVQGLVIPDQYIVHKPTAAQGFDSIIKKHCGNKQTKIVYAADAQKPVLTVPVAEIEQAQFCLTNGEIMALARMVMQIESYYSDRKGSWCPMDIEWAKDGNDGRLYIIQARPETVQSQKKGSVITTYAIKDLSSAQAHLLVTGMSIGQRIVSGPARVVAGPRDIALVQDGDILVTEMTDPDWVPAMKKAAGIVTERGGRTCHAAIVSRELGTPAVVGAEAATTRIKNGQQITLDCARGKIGFVYDGVHEFDKTEMPLAELPQLPVDLMVNIADPEGAFDVAQLPVQGVGLARLEFIISNSIRVHPMALLHPEKVIDSGTADLIEKITRHYANKKDFFVHTLAQGIGMIAAAFYPRPVIVRLSDFKTNEYRNLVGGNYFETQEENPMLGFRGASRYYSDRYKEAFALECVAIRAVRLGMGLSNVIVMVPFVRTTAEAQLVLQEMAAHGLTRGVDGLKVYMMVEIPSNVVLIDAFTTLFDGISIGSNDLTQLTLGVDRDSELLAQHFDERDPAVMRMLALAVQGAKKNKVHSGICGQAPSDFPEFADFLIAQQIDSLSLNPDSVLPFLMRYKK